MKPFDWKSEKSIKKWKEIFGDRKYDVRVIKRRFCAMLENDWLLRKDSLLLRDALCEFLEEYYGKIRFLEEKTIGKVRADMIAVLPEPIVSVAMSKNPNLRVALNVTDEWTGAVGSDSLVQGCIVVRAAFLEEHPAEVAKFLEEYKASIEYLNANVAEASAMVVDLGIYAGAPAVAEKAIPKCNIVYMDGKEMETALSAFLSAMYDINPASVGGQLPAADFYYKK